MVGKSLLAAAAWLLLCSYETSLSSSRSRRKKKTNDEPGSIPITLGYTKKREEGDPSTDNIGEVAVERS